MAISGLKSRFKAIVGLSDHTLELSIPIAAVAVGAKIIEKHFILDRKLGGPDASFSLEPDEFAKMVAEVRKTEKAIGEKTYKLTERARKARKFARSLFVIKDMQKWEKLTEENVRSIRPSDGLHPKYLKDVLGRRVGKPVKKGTPLTIGLLLESDEDRRT